MSEVVNKIDKQIMKLKIWLTVQLATFRTIAGWHIRLTIQAFFFRSELPMSHELKLII